MNIAFKFPPILEQKKSKSFSNILNIKEKKIVKKSSHLLSLSSPLKDYIYVQCTYTVNALPFGKLSFIFAGNLAVFISQLFRGFVQKYPSQEHCKLSTLET